MSLIEGVLNGDRLALARLLTRVENGEPEGIQALEALYPYTGKAHRVGITGAPGTGKSTLVNRLAFQLRHADGLQEGATSNRSVAIVAVDPSSPFTGGAILGDRIRMRDLAGDQGVFIRSMATRGALGGLARTTTEVVQVFDAAGFDVILIETVGAGQAEVDIAKAADTTVVVDAPGRGDDVQAIKAGILEIADILVVNKADIQGADNTIASLRMALDLGKAASRSRAEPIKAMNDPAADDLAPWETPVLATVATSGEGVEELVEQIIRHKAHLDRTGGSAQRERLRVKSEMEHLLSEMLISRFHAAQPNERFERALERVLAREIAPHQAVRELIEDQET